MEILDKINPAVIFAALAILFAILNFLLWVMVWKNLEGANSGGKPAEGNIAAIQEIKDIIIQQEEKASKSEDQMWGILDKLKELENSVTQLHSGMAPQDNKEIIAEITAANKKILEDNVSRLKSGMAPKDNKEIIAIINQAFKKIAAVLGELFKEFRKFSATQENINKHLDKMENLNEILESMDGSIAMLNSQLKKIEK